MHEKMSGQRGVVSNLSQLNDKIIMPPPEPICRKTDQFEHGRPNQNHEIMMVGKEPSSQDLIEMAATQCLKESETGDPMMINRKINTQAF